MANQVNNPNEIAHAQISIGVDGLESLKAQFAEAKDQLDNLGKTIDKVKGEGGSAPSASGGGGGGGSGIAGLLGGLRGIASLFGVGAGILGIKRMVEDFVAANVQLEKMRFNVTNLNSDMIAMRQAAADMNVSTVSRLSGVPEALLRAPSQGPAQRAAREMIGGASDKAQAAYNALNEEYQNAERIRAHSGSVGVGLYALLNRTIPPSKSDVDMAMSKMQTEASNAQKLIEAARRSDQTDQVIAIRRMGSSRRR